MKTDQNNSAVVLLPVKRQEDRRRFESAAPNFTFYYNDDAPIEACQLEKAAVNFRQSEP